MKIKFTDGVESRRAANTASRNAATAFHVVGKGGLIPVKDRAEGETLFAMLKKLP